MSGTSKGLATLLTYSRRHGPGANKLTASQYSMSCSKRTILPQQPQHSLGEERHEWRLQHSSSHHSWMQPELILSPVFA